MSGDARKVEFLLEIGCEEIPAGWLVDVTTLFGERFQEIAAREHLAPSGVEAHSTPRRLVVRADVREGQPDREEPVWGPSLKVAKDAAGKWTKAAEGFARKCGVEADALVQAPKDAAKLDESSLLFNKRTPGAPSVEVLPAVIAATLRALGFPTRMSWDAWLDDGKGAFPFGRPIRWIVALLGGKVVPFTIHEVVNGAKGKAVLESGDVTYGHRFLPRGNAGKAVRVSGFAELKAKLRERHVILDARERSQQIEKQLAARGASAGIRDDQGLREEWPQLVEWPNVVVGSVPEEFRMLPVEVLETVLIHHQKYIPVFDGGQVARFAALTNIDDAAGAEVVRGMERVCVARFRDARFFYEHDCTDFLEARVQDLEGVTFHQRLGSYRQKVDRLVGLVDEMAAAGWLDEGRLHRARKAARLCKADLTTAMVREFTELQGKMGGVYLAVDREDVLIAKAVYWHYHPIAIREDDAPRREDVGDSLVFGATSLADKIDTLAGYFSLGLEPKGSSDPFGLRRAGQGVVRVLLDFWTAEPRPSLRRLIAAALAAYPDGIAGDRVRSGTALEQFLRDRIEYALEARGVSRDEVWAVMAAPAVDAFDDPRDAEDRGRALHSVRAEAPTDFAALAEAFKRANNILSGQQPAKEIDAKHFERDSERELHAAIQKLQKVEGSYAERLRALASLREPIDRVFAREQDGGVLVMAADPRVRANRLALLDQARALFHRIADISKLQGEAAS